MIDRESRNTPESGHSPCTFKSRTFFERTDVTFSELSDAEITGYVAGGSPMDKAGAYGIQDDLGALFVERIAGDYYNVVGFPLNRFYREMKTFASGVVSVEM
jgi:septum formation protein